MSRTYSYLLMHIVFGTADRAPLITSDIRDGLYEYMGGIMREMGAVTVIINGMPDHVHVLVSVPLTLTVPDLVRVVKTNSSRWVHEKWPEQRTFGWQKGYGVFSVSRLMAPQVERYINEQQKHHRKFSFEEEYRVLLRRHNIEFDERYLWT
jgi:REP element-mobilizing transposase RayT